MYTKEEFIRDCISAFADTAGNTVDIPGTGNTVLYDIPLIGFAAADDPLFVKFLQPEIIGANFLTPAKWLPSAGTVVSISCLLRSKSVSATGRTRRIHLLNGCMEELRARNSLQDL